jgi:hypothetical protein
MGPIYDHCHFDQVDSEDEAQLEAMRSSFAEDVRLVAQQVSILRASVSDKKVFGQILAYNFVQNCIPFFQANMYTSDKAGLYSILM